MRVIGGEWGGRILPARVPPETRPTQDAVREAIFNMLTSRLELEGIRVLDLFAGTGALGIEALSRGASSCTFVERSRRARAAIEENCQALGVERERYRIVARDAIDFLKGSETTVDLVFADPPYTAVEQVVQLCREIERSRCVPSGAIIVLEHAAYVEPPIGEHLHIVIQRRWGQTACTIFERR